MNPCETCAFSDCGSDYYVCLIVNCYKQSREENEQSFVFVK